MRTKYKIGSFGLVVIAIAAAATLSKSLNTEQEPQRYETARVTRRDIVKAVAVTGTVRPTFVVAIGSQVSGTVSGVFAEDNDRVRKNEPLAQLDPILYQAELDQTQAALSGARTAQRVADSNYERSVQLNKSGMISGAAMEQALQARDAAVAQVTGLIAKARADRANLAFTTLRSPVNGVVVEKSVEIGQTVAASFQAPTLFKIAQDLTKMQVEFSVLEDDIGQVLPGQIIKFSAEAFPRRTWGATVRQIRLTPISQQGVVSYIVVGDCSNEDRALLPGMTAQGVIELVHRQNVLSVPIEALAFRPQGATGTADESTVYELLDGGLVRRPGRVRLSDGKFAEFESSELRDGDLVVVGSVGNPSKVQSKFAFEW